jgi:hypothetical protein
MHDEQPQRDVMAQGASDGGTGRSPMSRRQVMGRMSAVATAGAVAWVVPEILTAKPAAGAALSGTGTGTGGTGSVGASGGVSTDASTGSTGTNASVGASGSVNGPDGVVTAADTKTAADPSGSLAFTGLNIERDASVGAALVAGGWAMQHWASRVRKPAVDGPSGGV